MKTIAKLLRLGAVCAASTAPALAGDPLPVTGLQRTELDAVDTLMLNFMDANNIRGGVLGIMRNGVVIYQRGFGYHDQAETIAMPENSLVRMASCTKPITAAAIQQLVLDGDFSTGDAIFNVGQVGGGLLNVNPWGGLGDTDYGLVTVQDCLIHQGGWDRGITGDFTRMECTIASQMGVASPPGRANTMDWILGQSLVWTPGTTQRYSNEGYVALGLLVEQASGMSYLNFVRSRVLTPNMWVPWTDIRLGRTFPENQPVREAWYDSQGNGTCVFPRNGEDACTRANSVPNAYGTFDLEARVSQGAMLISAATMLRLAETYNVQVYNANIGAPLGGVRNTGNHNGGLPGTNALIQQRTDGVNFFVFFNQDDPTNSNFASTFGGQLNTLLNSQTDWPTLPVDGFWVHPNLGFQGIYGSLNRPYNQLTEALPELGDGSIVNFWPGDSGWTGTIDKKLLLRAPIGVARIGG